LAANRDGKCDRKRKKNREQMENEYKWLLKAEEHLVGTFLKHWRGRLLALTTCNNKNDDRSSGTVIEVMKHQVHFLGWKKA